MSAPLTEDPTRFKAARTIAALIFREISSTYGRSSAGYLWALAEPVGGIAFLTIIFSLALRSPSIGDSFGLYYATGMLPLTLYVEVSRKTARSVSYSKALMSYPRVTYVDAIIARALLNSLTSIMIGVFVLGGLIIMNPSFVFLNIPEMALSYFMAVCLALGIGSLNCFLFWKFTAWEQVWSIITRPLFLISGVIFNFDDLPQVAQQILWWNPIVHIVGQMRMGVFATYEPTYISYLFVFGLSTLTLALGLILLTRYHQDIMYS